MVAIEAIEFCEGGKHAILLVNWLWLLVTGLGFLQQELILAWLGAFHMMQDIVISILQEYFKRPYPVDCHRKGYDLPSYEITTAFSLLSWVLFFNWARGAHTRLEFKFWVILAGIYIAWAIYHSQNNSTESVLWSMLLGTCFAALNVSIISLYLAPQFKTIMQWRIIQWRGYKNKFYSYPDGIPYHFTPEPEYDEDILSIHGLFL